MVGIFVLIIHGIGDMLAGTAVGTVDGIAVGTIHTGAIITDGVDTITTTGIVQDITDGMEAMDMVIVHTDEWLEMVAACSTAVVQPEV